MTARPRYRVIVYTSRIGDAGRIIAETTSHNRAVTTHDALCDVLRRTTAETVRVIVTSHANDETRDIRYMVVHPAR